MAEKIKYFANSDSVILKRVRLDWNDLWTPAKSQDAAKKDNPEHDRYRARVIIDPDSEALSKAKAGLLQAATRMWGDEAKEMLNDIPSTSKALRDGNKNKDDDGKVRADYKDKFFLQSSNKAAPQVVHGRRWQDEWITIGENGRAYLNGKDVTDKVDFTVKKPYRGCYVDLKIQFVAGRKQKTQTGATLPDQVYAQLEAVKFVGDGPAFGRGAPTAEGFEDEEESDDDEDDDIEF